MTGLQCFIKTIHVNMFHQAYQTNSHQFFYLQAAASAADLFDSMILRGIEISEAVGKDLQAKKPGSLKNRCEEARTPQESMPGGLEACLAWHW